MTENSKIAWTDHTFNPWRGCEKVASGCAKCYAATMSRRNPGTLGVWGRDGTRVFASSKAWRDPYRWNDQAKIDRRIFTEIMTTPGICTVDIVKSRRGSLTLFAVEASLKRLDARGLICANRGNLGGWFPVVDEWRRPRVFVASLADVFEDWPGVMTNSRGEIMLLNFVETSRVQSMSREDWAKVAPNVKTIWQPMRMADARAMFFVGVVDVCDEVDFLVLTKRPENVRRMLPSAPPRGSAVADTSLDFSGKRSNLWLGTSVAVQADADRNIPSLLSLRDLCRFVFVSAEPMIEAIRFDQVQYESLIEIDCLRGRCGVYRPLRETCDRIDWLIVGGESGDGARPFDIEWARSALRQCREAGGVRLFIKQLGARPMYSGEAVGWPRSGGDVRLPITTPDGLGGYFVKLVDKKGGDMAEWPEDLRVREVPR